MSTLTLTGGDPSLRDLRTVPAEERCAVLLQMVRNSAGEARQSMLRVGAELVPERDLIALLREEADDVARNAGLEMLKLRGRRALPCAVALLGDPDDDVVMQCVQLIEHAGDPRSWRDVRVLLYHSNPNVVQAVIAASPRVGGTSAAIDLLPFVSEDPWLQVTAIDALGRLRSRLAVPFLRKLLDDPMMAEFASEALARIGGVVAVHVLADFFLEHRAHLDAGRWLGLLGCALADLEHPYGNPGLREGVRFYLRSEHAHAAAACMLALGPDADDDHAVEALAQQAPATPLPLCLVRRHDLIPHLLRGGEPLSSWGLALARRWPKRVAEEVLARALLDRQPNDAAVLEDIAPHLTSAGTLVMLFAGESAEGRAALYPVLSKVAADLPAAVVSRDIDPADRILLLEIAGADAASVADGLRTLDTDGRIAALRELRTAAVAEQLPWREWIDGDRETYLPLFADVAGRCPSEQLRALFRALLREEASPVLVKAAGSVADPQSVSLLIAAYDSCSPLTRAFAVEALGEIGGADARTFLRGIAFGAGSENRLACRAFARCACAEDLKLVEELTAHDDWAVRLAGVEALGRLGAGGHPSLKALVADASSIVAQRASALLELAGRDE